MRWLLVLASLALIGGCAVDDPDDSDLLSVSIDSVSANTQGLDCVVHVRWSVAHEAGDLLGAEVHAELCGVELDPYTLHEGRTDGYDASGEMHWPLGVDGFPDQSCAGDIFVWVELANGTLSDEVSTPRPWC